MVSVGLKAGGCLSLFVIFIAFLYKWRSDEILHQRKDLVLSGLLRAEKKVSLPKTKIALGFGGCLDIIVDAMKLFKAIDLKPPAVPKHYDSVETREELSQLMAYFFAYGAAAERYISSSSLFKTLKDAAEKQPEMRKLLGGNAAVMARRLANEGAEVLLAARFTKSLADTLPSDVKLVGLPLEEDDIHLLMEYKTGEQWGRYVSPRANRLIVHNDYSNPLLETLEDMENEIKLFNPSTLVIGGLQMMDSYPFLPGQRERRIQKLRAFVANIPRSTKIHFEMASFADQELMSDLVDSVVFYSDSLGMNEQELPNLVSILSGGNISLISESNPRVATVLDQMRMVYNLLKDTKEIDGRRRLSRIHLHTLAYQAILTTKGSDWRNSMSAAAKASLTAYRHVCGSEYIDVMKARLIMDESFSTSQSESGQRIPLQETRPVSCWDEAEFEICVAPVLVCTDVLQTGGGGDNISSAGLLFQA